MRRVDLDAVEWPLQRVTDQFELVLAKDGAAHADEVFAHQHLAEIATHAHDTTLIPQHGELGFVRRSHRISSRSPAAMGGAPPLVAGRRSVRCIRPGTGETTTSEGVRTIP